MENNPNINSNDIRKWMELFEKKDFKIKTEEDKRNWKIAKIFMGSFAQIEWERNVAIKQLEDLGYKLGEKM